MSINTDMLRASIVGSIAAVLAVGCATSPAPSSNMLAYNGGPIGLGVTPSAADLAGKHAYPADGRGLPPGSGTYEQGKAVYQQKCLACHGDKLQGSPLGDRLIGGRGTLVNNDKTKPPVKTVESYWPYATTVFDYVQRAMPFNAPGSLSDNEVYAVTAYILGEANVVPKGDTLNAQTLPMVKMPNRDGFISPDPRPDVR